MPIEAFIISLDAVETFILYDKDGNEQGTAEKVGEEGEHKAWFCDLSADGARLTNDFRLADDALAWLKDRGKDILVSGGFIEGMATFRVHPDENSNPRPSAR